MEHRTDARLQKALLGYLARSHAHASLEKSAAGLPASAINATVPGVPYTPWMLLEHIRITAHDMLEFVRNPEYKAPEWPAEYWPPRGEHATPAMWKKSLEECGRDLRGFEAIIRDGSRDLFAKIPWGEGQTVFLEILQMMDHTSYHVGQLVLLRRALGVWEDQA